MDAGSGLVVVVPAKGLDFLENLGGGEVVEGLFDEVVVDVRVERVTCEGVLEGRSVPLSPGRE